MLKVKKTKNNKNYMSLLFVKCFHFKSPFYLKIKIKALLIKD
jgi:hypothetical protein